MGYNYNYKGVMMNITIEDLERFSINGDQNAKRILNSIEQFRVQKLQQVTSEARAMAGDITAILGKPEVYTDCKRDPWLEIAEIAKEIADVVDPVDDDTEIIG